MMVRRWCVQRFSNRPARRPSHGKIYPVRSPETRFSAPNDCGCPLPQVPAPPSVEFTKPQTCPRPDVDAPVAPLPIRSADAPPGSSVVRRGLVFIDQMFQPDHLGEPARRPSARLAGMSVGPRDHNRTANRKNPVISGSGGPAGAADSVLARGRFRPVRQYVQRSI